MATHTEQLAKVVKTNTDLTTAITGELDKWQAQRNSAKDELQKAVGAVVNNRIDLYVDAESGDDSNSGLSIATSLKTLDKALELAAPARDKRVTILLKGGHIYQITKVVAISALRLNIATLNNPTYSHNYQEIKEHFAQVENIALVDESDEFNSGSRCVTGILASPSANQTIYFTSVILKTADIPLNWGHSIWQGLVNRNDFRGQANVIVTRCYLDLGSPLVKSASGVGYINFDSYLNHFNLTRLIASRSVYNYVISNHGKVVKCNFAGVNHTDTQGITGSLSKYLVQCAYNSTDPGAEPRNVISNLDLRRSQTLRS